MTWSPSSGLPAVPVPFTMRRADGTTGVTAAEGAEAGPVPALLVAETVKVYVVPLVSPVTVCDVLGDEKVCGVWATLAIYGVTVYEVMDAPPSPGADHDTVASPLPATALTPFGAAGAVGGAPGTVVATVVVTVVATVLVVAEPSEPPFPDPFGWATVDCFDPETPPVFVDSDCGVARPADGPPAPFSVASPPKTTFPELVGRVV